MRTVDSLPDWSNRYRLRQACQQSYLTWNRLKYNAPPTGRSWQRVPSWLNSFGSFPAAPLQCSKPDGVPYPAPDTMFQSRIAWSRMTATDKKLLLAMCSACLLLGAPGAGAQVSDISSVHWAYSSYFGTGWYEVDGDRNVYVLGTTPRWELRVPDFTAGGTRAIGIELTLPITAGMDIFSIDNIPGTVDLDNLASISVTPGINITIPLTRRWWLRPFAAFGWGTLLNGSESAWTYWAGVRSRYVFETGELHWALVNSLTYVGHTPSDGSSEDFQPIMAGLELDHRLFDARIDDEQLWLSWHGTYTAYEHEVELGIRNVSPQPITDQWEFGLAFRKQDRPIKIGWFSFDRLGLAYSFSSSGELRGISFVFRSVFDR